MYGACDAIESLTSVPEHRNVEPPYVKARRTTAVAALVNAAGAGSFDTQATSTSQLPDRPIALNGSAAALRSEVATPRCEIIGISSVASPGETPGGSASSIVARSPSITGDQ